MLGRRSFAYVGFLVLTTSGCEVMPGTEAYKIAQAKRAAAELLIDPAAAQFQDVTLHGEYVCGSINGKNRMGAFVGFKRFFVSLVDSKALIDPEFKVTDLMDAQESCRSLSSNSYSTPSLIASACERESEQQASSMAQASFDATWSKHCEAPGARQVYRPELVDPAVAGNAADVDLDENLTSNAASDLPESESTVSSSTDEQTANDNEVSEDDVGQASSQDASNKAELDRIFGGSSTPRSSGPAPTSGSEKTNLGT